MNDHNIAQINLNHCWGAHDMLQNYIKEKEIDIVIIAEPVNIPDGNWARSDNKGAAICWSNKIRERIKVVYNGNDFVAIELGEIVIFSCYIPPKKTLKEFSRTLKEIENCLILLEKGKQAIIGGDFNAHSKTWGTKNNTDKGIRLVNWAERNNLILKNSGDRPTCVRPQGISVIDLTWATANIANRIKDWTVEEGYLSLSDHNYITFIIKGSGRKGVGAKGNGRKESGTANKRWKMDTLEQEIYEVLKWKCEMHRIGEWTTEEGVRKDIDWIQETMTEAADAAMKRAKRRPNQKQAYWWNENIAAARTKCIQDRRKWTRAKSKKKRMDRIQEGREEEERNLHHLGKEFKKSRRNVVTEIYKAKEKAWRELISEIDEDQWGRPYKIVMNRLRAAGPGLTETLEEDKLKKLVIKLFPRETRNIAREVTRVGNWKEEWSISAEEMCNTIRKKKRNTAFRTKYTSSNTLTGRI
ncbi:Reverse transcriptase [Camponotus japonicus]